MLQLLASDDVRLPFVERDLTYALRLPMFAHSLKLLMTGESNFIRTPLPALLSVSGSGKSRYLYELANFTELAVALQQTVGVSVVPIAVTFNNVAPWIQAKWAIPCGRSVHGCAPILIARILCPPSLAITLGTGRLSLSCDRS